MLRIKLCGLTTPAQVEEAVAAGATQIGLVFAPSRRQVTLSQAVSLARHVPAGIGCVGVFCNQPPDVVATTAKKCFLTAVQLHGDEDAAYLSALRPLLPEGVQVWKAVCLGEPRGGFTGSIPHLKPDLWLLDAAVPGSGEVFNWALTKPWQEAGIPFLLAGGLHPGNVGDAIRSCRPMGVDVSSGVETDGVKDAIKMRAFIRAVREAE